MSHPDRWLVLTVRAPHGGPARELLGEALLALGGASVLEEDETLTTYLPPPADLDAFRTDARQRLAAVVPAQEPPDLTWRWQADQDWEREWRRDLQPRKLTRRLVVKPTWAVWEAGPGEVVIEIDPQMAFGTGEHPSTRGCLRLLDGAIRGGERVLDVGTGSAILAIAAALIGAEQVLALEADPLAIPTARENLERYDLTAKVELRQLLVTSRNVAGLGTFDVITGNILSSVLRPLLPSLREALRPGGRLIVAGILQDESDEFLAAARAAGFDLAHEDREEEWWTALLEPFA